MPELMPGSSTTAPVMDDDGVSSLLPHLQSAFEQAAKLLPTQGPITVFVAQNILAALDDLPYDTAIQKGGRILGCEPYLSKDWYRAQLQRGRISENDLRNALREDLGARLYDPILSLCSREELRMAMLLYPIRTAPESELRWFISETDALKRIRSDAPASLHFQWVDRTRRWLMRDIKGDIQNKRTKSPSESLVDHASEGQGYQERRARLVKRLKSFAKANVEEWSSDDWESMALRVLWMVCRDGAESVTSPSTSIQRGIRHRDWLWAATSEDTDLLVNETLIRFSSAFLDQGLSNWQLPDREKGFLQAFVSVYGGQGGCPPNRWMKDLCKELQNWENRLNDPWKLILESLQKLGVDPSDWEDYLTATMLNLRGWAGMMRQVEIRGETVANPIRPGSLVEFVAVRLLLDRLAITYIAKTEMDYTGPLDKLWEAARPLIQGTEKNPVEQRAFDLFQLSQLMGWFADDLLHLSQEDWKTLVQEIEDFSTLERRRICNRAFESRVRTWALDAIARHRSTPFPPHEVPQFQVACCLDDREESFRRHIEEICPRAETFGMAGFFNLPMYYRGATDAHFVPHCPIVLKPQHWITENVAERLEKTHRKILQTRRRLGTASHHLHVRSRSVASGALLTAGFGIFASIPLVARILFPRLTGRIRRTVSKIVRTPDVTQLQIERSEVAPGPHNGGIGFSVEEMTAIGEKVLRDMGLISGFSRLVFMIGHKSGSQNNPHNSAYDCGACSGKSGGPNARAVAQILNDSRIREELALRGLKIPAETHFIGGVHNTCDDSVQLFDLDLIPASHQTEFETARKIMDEAGSRNAHERCRRFMSAPLNLTFEGARSHVEGRAEDLAQTRPECGHATNALCIIGRRWRTKGLFLDRRAFLTSYDASQDDPSASILTRILAAAVPVCVGINLTYNFSYIDNTGWGCGVKLPHNLTGLIGVMDGAQSDLRTGLPWQMVEIHEPVRLLFVVETSPQILLDIMERNPSIGKMCRNEWLQLATLDPNSSRIDLFSKGTFQEYIPESSSLPHAPTSVDWYRGWRDNLEFAEIGGAEGQT